MVDKILLYRTDKNNVNTDITKLCNDIKWIESSGENTMELTFNVPDTNEKYIEHYMIEAGDKIQLLYNNEIKYVFVVTEVEREYPFRKVSAKDFCWYLEKNEIIIQFIGVSIKKAVEMICAKLGITPGEICDLPAEINGVYIDSADSILKEILELQRNSNGSEYSYEMRGNKLTVYKLPEEAENYMYKPAENVAAFDVTEHHTRCKYKHSINNMSNSVTAVIKSNTEENLPAIEYTVTDADNVKRYGKLSTKIDVSAE